MKKHEVKVGGTYSAKVSDKVVTVRLDKENAHGGWDATNLTTGKKVRIKSVQRLRGAVPKSKPSVAANQTSEATSPPTDAQTRKAKIAAWRKEVAEQAARPNPQLEAEIKAAQEAQRTKKTGTAKPKHERKPSGLDIAAQVLKDSGQPMTCGEVMKIMLDQKLWQTTGKTPAATLYAAIIREIAEKKDQARFRKVERGKFTLAK